MKKIKDVPVTVTQTELYVLAIHMLETRIHAYEDKRTEYNGKYVDMIVEPMKAKIEIIKQMYLTEQAKSTRIKRQLRGGRPPQRWEADR